MSKLMSSAAVMRPVKKDLIVIDLDDDNEDVVCDTDYDWGTEIDGQCLRLLDSFREVGDLYLRDNPLRSIRYEADNGGYDKRIYKEAVTNKRSREDQNVIRVLKKNVKSKLHTQASEEKSAKVMVNTRHVKRNLQHNYGHVSKKENFEDEMVLDKTCRSSLVEKSKNSRMNLGKEIQVKCEEDLTIPLSDCDSDIIAVGDCPFLDEEGSPFVPSIDPKPIDLDDESDTKRNSWFRKELMKVLKQPFSITELKELRNEASVHRRLTRCSQLLDGGEITYETEEKIPSYLDMYPALEIAAGSSSKELEGTHSFSSPFSFPKSTQAYQARHLLIRSDQEIEDRFFLQTYPVLLKHGASYISFNSQLKDSKRR